MSAILPGEVRPTTERPSSSVGVLTLAYSSEISRPTIMRMRVARSTSASARDRRSAVAEDRVAVGDVKDLRKAMRDVDDAATLFPQSAHDGEELVSFALADRRGRLVMKMTSASWLSALAISTSCIWATERLCMDCVAGIAKPDCPGSPARRRSSCESRCVRTRPGGSRPRKTFSATVMCGTGLSSCSIMAMPEASASAGLLNSTSRPLAPDCAAVAAVNAHDDREKGRFPAPLPPQRA